MVAFQAQLSRNTDVKGKPLFCLPPLAPPWPKPQSKANKLNGFCLERGSQDYRSPIYLLCDFWVPFGYCEQTWMGKSIQILTLIFMGHLCRSVELLDPFGNSVSVFEELPYNWVWFLMNYCKEQNVQWFLTHMPKFSAGWALGDRVVC